MTMIDILEKLAPIAISIGLTGWVYNTLNSVIKGLRDDIANLVSDIEKMKADLEKEKMDKNKWYKKYHKLLELFSKYGSCKENCPLSVQVNKHLSEEGETI